MIDKIINKQREFQKLVGSPIDTIVESERNELAEVFLFKAIEEIIELRKEFPSAMNKWSKSQKIADVVRIHEELSDVILFLVNFIIVFKIDIKELSKFIEIIQTRNFDKIKIKMLDLLNEDILKVPNCVAGVGQGNLSPKYIFIGQNPGEGITKGYKFWKNPEDGSSKVLLPILEDLGILKDCYFTNIVKCTTLSNSEPTPELTSFWNEFLDKELKILSANCDPIIVTMGNWAGSKVEQKHINIPHPSYVLRGGMDKTEYEQKIKKALTLNN